MNALGPLDPDGALNVLGEPLAACSTDPVTGFYRNGFCSAGPEDAGRHLVCCEMSDEFLAFSKARGNDLSTARPEYAFPGLVAGDRWCLVADRWVEAFNAGHAPRVALLSTNRAVLGRISLADLKRHALDLS